MKKIIRLLGVQFGTLGLFNSAFDGVNIGRVAERAQLAVIANQGGEASA